MSNLPDSGGAGQTPILPKTLLLDNGSVAPATPGCGAPDVAGVGNSSLVSCSYGQMVHLELFPGAVIKESSNRVRAGKHIRSKRGKISGLSEHSASRLREFLLTWHVPGREVWAVSLTIRRVVSPGEWRECWHRFRDRARRCLTAAVYRVELQRRKVPHIHAAVWLVAWNQEQDLQLRLRLVHQHFEQLELWHVGWFDSITAPGPDGKRVYDYAEYKHAMHARRIEDEGWAIYQSLHHGKAKREQLGWIGKQWGVIGRALFKRRKPVQLELSLRQYWTFRRVMRRLLRARGAKRTALPAHGRWVRCIDQATVEKLAGWCKAVIVEGA